MWYNQLEKHDYEILESYWVNFREIVGSKERCPLTASSIERIVSAVSTLYNASDGLLRDFIDHVYFSSRSVLVNEQIVAEELGITKNKALMIRESLLKDTAKLIGWV